MGINRSSTFSDFNTQGSAAHAKGRASGVYSDDEYESVKTDKRTKPFTGDQEWKNDPNAGKEFWGNVDDKQDRGYTGDSRNRDEYAKKVWDEFDDFFQFNDEE
jgi:hypothetical protein